MRSQSLTQQVGMLAIDLNVLRLVVIKIVAENLRASENSNDALRQFADEVHKKIDKGATLLATIQGMIEIARDRVDGLMHAVQVELSGEDC